MKKKTFLNWTLNFIFKLFKLGVIAFDQWCITERFSDEFLTKVLGLFEGPFNLVIEEPAEKTDDRITYALNWVGVRMEPKTVRFQEKVEEQTIPEDPAAPLASQQLFTFAEFVAQYGWPAKHNSPSAGLALLDKP